MLPKFAHANETKESITSQKIGSRDFWQIADSVLNTDKSAITPIFNDPEVLSSTSNKIKNSTPVDGSGISLPVFSSKTNLKLYNISVKRNCIIFVCSQDG